MFDPKSTFPETFIIGNTLRFAFDGDGFYQAGFEVNGTHGVTFGTVVWMSFAGYDTNEDPVFLFSYRMLDPFQPITPHDHRDNSEGGFAFSMYHPGTAVFQMLWSL